MFTIWSWTYIPNKKSILKNKYKSTPTQIHKNKRKWKITQTSDQRKEWNSSRRTNINWCL